MAWFLLVLASVCEIAWAVSLKQTDGFSRLGPTLLTLVVMLVSVALLALAVRTLPIGTAYAVWTGLGAAGTVLVGILWLGEPATPWRLVCVALIVLGVMGLKLVD